MKKSIKFLIIGFMVVMVLIILINLFPLSNIKYTDSYNTLELYKLVSDSFSNDEEINILDEDVIFEFYDEKPEYVLDYTVIKSKNAKDINEIGIFKIQSDKIYETKKIIQEYVSKLQASYRAMDYFPEEIEKINFATVKVYGNYVIYSFLNENDTKSFYDAIKLQLKNGKKALSF